MPKELFIGDVKCVQLESSFELDKKFYPTGSWLVKSPSDTYAKAMTDKEFNEWREKCQK